MPPSPEQRTRLARHGSNGCCPGKGVGGWTGANPNGQYGDWSHLTPAERNELQGYFQSSGWEAYNFLGGGRGNHIARSGEYGAQVGARLLARFASSSTTAGDPNSFTPNALYTDTAPENWRRCDPANTELGESEPYAGFAFCVDRTKKPLAQPTPGTYAMNVVNGRATTEQSQQY